MDAFEEGMVCPYFQRNDRRCARRFNLQHLSEVFEDCLGDPWGCEVFHELSIESARSRHESRSDTDVAA